MERKKECFVCTREVIRETVFKGQKLSDWLDGPKDDKGNPAKDEEGEVIKGFKARRMQKGPTLVSIKTRKFLIGTGIYKNKTAGNLDKTFG